MATLAIHQASAAPRTVGCTRGMHVARAASSSGLYGAFDTSGMETQKMNLFTALNDGMRAALEADDTAVRGPRGRPCARQHARSAERRVA